MTMPSIKFLRETNGALCDIWNIEDGITEAASSDMAADKDGPEVEALWIEDAINELQKEIDHKIWYMNKKKQDMSGPYGSVYSSAYKKNMRDDFARFKGDIKVWKSEIKELTKKKKDLEKKF
jgi:hypothetical protein